MPCTIADIPQNEAKTLNGGYFAGVLPHCKRIFMSRALCFIARGVFAVRELLISVRKIFCQRQKFAPISADNYNTPLNAGGLNMPFYFTKNLATFTIFSAP